MKSASKRIDWKNQPLGLFPDYVIAENMGVSSSAVFAARRRFRIPRCQIANNNAVRLTINWDAEPLLGTVPDKTLALRLGVTSQAVYYARRQRGIASPNKQVRPPCDPSVFEAELGTATDAEVARRHGLHWQQVAARRRKIGKRSTRIDWDNEPLGSVPDIVLARKHGVDNKSVAQARWHRKISKWQEERQCPCGEKFIAFHLRQKFCCFRCQRYHWHLVKEDGMEPEAADLAVAMAALRRTLRKKGKGTNTCGKLPTTFL